MPDLLHELLSTEGAHQIKTPIAAMKLLCQEDDSGRGREMTAELLRVEQYVDPPSEGFQGK